MTNYTLITGATSPVGRAIAFRLSETRALILHGRRHSQLEDVLARCESPETHLLWNCDLAAPSEVEQRFPEFLAQHEATVCAFVHCAGISPRSAMRSMDADAIERICRVNFIAPAAMLSAMLRRHVNSSQLEAVVFISSVASQFGVKGLGVYGATKAAADALMRSLAVELAPKVRLNSVLPGGLITGGPDPNDAELSRKLQSAAPLGTGHPEDVAGAVEFLLSHSARWITGQQLVVDGGFTINATL